MTLNIYGYVAGLNDGFDFVKAWKASKEIMEGRTYALLPAIYFMQTIQACNIINGLTAHATQPFLKMASKIAVNYLPFTVFIGTGLCAYLKLNNYEKIAQQANNACLRRFGFELFPKQLGQRSIRIINFTLEHFSTINAIASSAAIVALMILGTPFYGKAFTVSICYEVARSQGWVPQKLNSFIDKYFSKVLKAATLVSGGGTMAYRISNVITLLSALPHSIENFLLHKIDSLRALLFKNILSINDLSLSEIESPFPTVSLNKDEIIKILKDGCIDHYEVVPQHYVQEVPTIEFKKETTYDDFLALFDEINWNDRYKVILGKIKHDERFQAFALSELSTNLKFNPNDLSSYVTELAKKKNKTEQQFITDWVRGELITFISRLKKEAIFEGSEQDLDQSIEHCQTILPYLKKLKKDLNSATLEDDLLELAVGCGGYCALGLKDTTSDLIRDITVRSFESHHETLDPICGYEREILTKLKSIRNNSLEQTYETRVGHIGYKIAGERHLYRIWISLYSAGFLPPAETYQEQLGLPEKISFALITAPMKIALREEYKQHLFKYEAFKKANAVAPYISSKMEAFKLSQEDQEEINALWESLHDSLNDFKRLALVMMGVLRKKT